MAWPPASQRVLRVLAALFLLAGIAPLTRDRALPPALPVADEPRLELRLELNRATAVDLASLPGIGPSLAAAIVTHRQRHGPFRTIDELSAIPGLRGPLVRTLRPYLSVEPPATERPSPPGS